MLMVNASDKKCVILTNVPADLSEMHLIPNPLGGNTSLAQHSRQELENRIHTLEKKERETYCTMSKTRRDKCQAMEVVDQRAANNERIEAGNTHYEASF